MNTHNDQRSALVSARQAALNELRAQPVVRGWKRDAVAAVSQFAAVSAAVTLGAFVLAIAETRRVPAHWPPVLLLFVSQALAVWAAVAPGPRSRRVGVVALGLGAVGVAMMIATRLAPGPVTSPRPGWVCSLSHLGVDVVPLLAGLWTLRQFAARPWRAALVGVAAGTLGAALGELSCARGWQHFLLHHLGAWLAVAVAAVVVHRFIRPRAFSP